MAKKPRDFLSVNAFAKLSRVTKDALLYYDRIGLLSPVSRGGDNNYRYYRCEQITIVNFIRTFQSLGMSLDEIKSLKNILNPETAERFYELQLEKISTKMDELVRTKKLVHTLQKSINSVEGINEKEITTKFMPEEAIILGELNDYSRGRNDYDVLLSFHRTMSQQYPEIDLNYPVWGIYSKDRVTKGDYLRPERMYFYNPEGHDKKPAALYAIGYNRSWYNQGRDVYKRLLKFIEKNNYEICGDFYEEYPLNEICIGDNKNYLVRVMVPIKKKRGKKVAGAVKA